MWKLSGPSPREARCFRPYDKFATPPVTVFNSWLAGFIERRIGRMMIYLASTMGAKMVAIRFLILIIGLALPQAAFACLAEDSPLRGELQRVEKRDPSGRLLTSFHIVLRDADCLQIATQYRGDVREPIRRVQIIPIDTDPIYLDKLIGAQVAARGRLEYPHAPWHTGDAVLLDAELIGIFGSAHDRYAYQRGKKYPHGYRYRTPDYPGPSLKDRPYRPDYKYRPPRFRKKAHAPYRRSALRDEVIYFITETYLKFQNMPSHIVRRHYWPRVHYRGRPEVRNDIIISEKFRDYQRWPDQIYEFDPGSVEISQSRYVPGAYDISFEFSARIADAGRTRRGWHRVLLTLDIKRGRIRICREDVESHWPDDDYKGRRRGLARAEIYPIE